MSLYRSPFLTSFHSRFKWVELQISLFFQPNSPFHTQRDVDDQIQKLKGMKGQPQLNKIWAQIIERNASGSNARKIADRVYKWLLFSFLSLSKKCLTEAVSDPPGSTSTAIDITTLCSNLIDVNKNMVQFAHPTVRQYLEQAKDKHGIKKYNARESHKQIATTCLEFLSTSSLPKKIDSSSFAAMEWNFEIYAAAFWPAHLREVTEVPKTDTLRELTNDFFFRKLAQASAQTSGQTSFKRWAEAWLKIVRDEVLKGKANGKGTSTGDIRFAAKYSEPYSHITSLLSTPPDPFFAACVFGLPDVCRKSDYSRLQKSEARNLNDELGVFLAIKSRRLDALQMLFSADVEVMNVWQSGNNALHWAAINGTAKMMELLLERGVDISSINDDGASILHLAAASPYDTLAKMALLSDKSLDPNRRDIHGATVLHYAVQNPLQNFRVSSGVIEKLEDLSINFNAADLTQETGLHYAAQNPNVSTGTVRKLLDEVKDINAVSQSGKTALAYSVETQSAPRITLKFIERQDASLDTVDDEGTILHRAVKNPKFSTIQVEKLVSKDSINKLDKLGRTALHCAFIPCHESSATYSIRNRTKSIALMLLRAGADCTLPDEKKATALHYLARAPIQPSDLIEEFLARKVNTNAVDSLQATALHIMLRHNKLSTAADLTALKQLIKANGDFSKADSGGETVFHRAIQNTAISADILKLLLESGAEVNATDQTGSTAMHYSVETRGPEITQLLIDWGADLKCLDSQQASALHRTSCGVTSARAMTITLT